MTWFSHTSIYLNLTHHERDKNSTHSLCRQKLLLLHADHLRTCLQDHGAYIPTPDFQCKIRIIRTLKQKCPQAATIIVAAACQQLALQCSCSHLNCSSTHLYHHTSTASSSIHLRWNHRRRSFLSFQHKMDQQCVLPSNTHANITSSNMNSKTATQLQANTHVRF